MTAASNADGAFVTLQPCTGADAQKWTFANGQVKIFGNSKCLDVTDGVNNDGTKLQIWSCAGSSNANQQWFYTGDYRLAWTNHGKCVDLTNGQMSAGNRVSPLFLFRSSGRFLTSLRPIDSSLDVHQQQRQPGLEHRLLSHPTPFEIRERSDGHEQLRYDLFPEFDVPDSMAQRRR